VVRWHEHSHYQWCSGLGFAIPINTVQGLQLIPRVEHPYLGVQMVTLTPEIKQQLEVDGRIRVAADQGVLYCPWFSGG